MKALPSVLALSDLRRSIQRKATEPLNATRALELLHLDPLVTLRLLRLATTPSYGKQPTALTLPMIANMVGEAVIRRALDVPVVAIAGAESLRKLWLHSIATALAARALAQGTADLDPEAAYLAGLLHDLPQWLTLLAEHAGSQHAGPFENWVRHWHLPLPLSEILLDLNGKSDGAPYTQGGTLIRAAELLAELAGFDDGLSRSPAALLQQFALLDSEPLFAAEQLRREVEHVLDAVGISLAPSGTNAEVADAKLQPTIGNLAAPVLPSTPDVLLGLLGSKRWKSYRSIFMEGTVAALRHFGFDRALYVTWMRASGCVAVRYKADLSSRRMVERWIAPAAGETEKLADALATERAVLLSATLPAAGLLHHFGMDEALAIPINRTFATPAFLLLDRTLSARNIDLPSEEGPATLLGLTISLLNENLLLKRRQQRAQKFAVTDPLTRLFNRRHGVLAVDQELARFRRSSRPLTVLMIDLDEFKKLNDAFGHLMGDVALRTTADVMRRTLRKSDTLCRFGGEEFLVVLPDTEPQDASILAARLFIAIEASGHTIGLPTTASIGLASAQMDDTIESLLARADRALYASKSLGRNRFSVDAAID
ncbi:MAG: GGDEF domain-containing protein [Planctomycetes bacterium]|nr:GGDEF domain-containing protein [Planctomycetota bacterium]